MESTSIHKCTVHLMSRKNKFYWSYFKNKTLNGMCKFLKTNQPCLYILKEGNSF